MMRPFPKEPRAPKHAPKIRAVVQISFIQSVYAASVEIFHRRMLLGEGGISKVEAKQKETKLTGNTS